ncbi:MAG: DUF6106 family protein [Lachnospiraceae bacterium]|nr:DUF6106 family protein [Lachnospiraceae bacterium]
MNESYVECLVGRKTSPLVKFLKILILVVAAFFVVDGLFAQNTVVFFLAVLVATAAYFLYPLLDVEYEYLYLDKEISIDKIMGKQRRKKVAAYDINKMEFLTEESSHELDSYKARKVKLYDYGSNDPANKSYIMVYHDDKEECLVKFEPNEEMLECIKNVAPRKVK